MVGASDARPNMGVRPDAPTIETIVLVTFYEIISFQLKDFPSCPSLTADC
jgi:hypothetical protein